MERATATILDLANTLGAPFEHEGPFVGLWMLAPAHLYYAGFRTHYARFACLQIGFTDGERSTTSWDVCFN